MASHDPVRQAKRVRRLAEELADEGLDLDPEATPDGLVLSEIDRALHPPVHERRVAGTGTIVEPVTDPGTWSPRTELEVNRGPVGEQPLEALRRFADGLSSWLIRRVDGRDEWLVFDRPAGSERDLVVLADVFGASIVQRHPSGAIRVVGRFGVLRWEGLEWHHEPPVASWIDAVGTCQASHDRSEVVQALLEFAVHDLGSRGIGATLVYRPGDGPEATIQDRLPAPPPLSILRPLSLAPLRHALAQVDGAAVFDRDGVLSQIGVRLVPSSRAERDVEGYRGMRHTSGVRYSYDDPAATVIVVSEDGPVSVLRNGRLVGRSPDVAEG
ncbi:MAG: DNA integrity scanning protein DisA nucleotide-binding domain protein [Acidimicrobiia bacterium]